MIKYYNYVLLILMLLLQLQSSECRHRNGHARAAGRKKVHGRHELERIIGGTAADPNESPYQVSLQYDKNHMCGGAILAPTWVVTAAHCIMEGITVLTGVYDLMKPIEAFRYEVEEMFQHCRYLDDKMNYDIGMIRTKKPISFNEKVAIIQLETQELERDAELRLTGWGATKYEKTDNEEYPDMEYPTIKQAMTFKYWPRVECNKKWVSKEGDEPVDEDALCAFNSFAHGACVGDSGSPLTHNGKLVGIASYVMACALGYPDVFVAQQAATYTSRRSIGNVCGINGCGGFGGCAGGGSLF
ncbi:chymotrypsin-1-like [Scaptodrosophila lebanonensis]|uniref:trypsin n=1 Tax=Drosophila lebanonensis TaxID=7225 RepID=A0A6J2T2R7_DROLE|nr:chymotrypsin-1-like [Scaptodrosophila lebanonensis]